MSRRTAGRLAWSLVGTSLVLAAVGVVIGVVGGADVEGETFPFVAAMAVVLVASVVGGLVASRQPQNPIGWMFCAFVLFNGVSALATGYTEQAIAGDGGVEGFGTALAWFANWSYVSFFALVVFVLLLFPDGRLPSPRWRVAAWCGAFGVAAFAFGVAFDPGPLHDQPEIVNPLGLSTTIAEVAQVSGMVATIGALGASVASVVVRFRTADGIARQQIKWLAAAGLSALAGVAIGGTVAGLGFENAGNAVTLLGVLGVPVSIGVAILRYRLYDIDRVISKALVYGSSTVLLALAYVGLVLAGQAVFSSFAGGSNLAIAVSTLVVAALFLPLRARVQRVVDRRFYRRRYDAQRTLDAFGARLREQTELDALAADLRGVVAETMQPVNVSLWLRREARS